MGILLVYDVTDESSFSNIRNWMRNIEAHASEHVVKALVGNKSDMDESRRAVPYSRGQVGFKWRGGRMRSRAVATSRVPAGHPTSLQPMVSTVDVSVRKCRRHRPHRVPPQTQALADEYKLPFFETSAKSNANVDEVFQAVARTVMARLRDSLPAGGEQGGAGAGAVRVGGPPGGAPGRYSAAKPSKPASSGCC